MAFGINVKADLREVEKMFSNLRRDVIPKAAARAINRAIDSAKTESKRDIAKQTKLPQKKILDHMFVSGATPQRLIAVLGALPYAPNLLAYKPQQNKAGVAASAWERRKTYKGSFILPSGKVVSRKTKERKSVRGLFGPSLPSQFMRARTIEVMKRAAESRWRSEFERDLARRLSS